ncbi:MAG: SMC family ATPase [Dehalobacterium sp.]
MRPLKMEISAFGPFAGREILDFQELGERSFFLIHGPTGSGKTTILDAMCFALYGDTSGAERTGDQMCCAFAGQEALTEVVFDFAMGDKKYRVCRRPQRKRLKKRGEGFTVEQATAELLDSTGAEDQQKPARAIASGWTNVTMMVEKILGFRSDQFRQVVMLPQGKFRQLLMADSRERQAILEVLFKTERYSRIESYMKQQAKSLEEDIRNKERAKTILLPQAGVSTLGELDEKIKEAGFRLAEITREIDHSEMRLREAQKQLEEGKRAQEKLADFRTAQSQCQELEKKKDSIEILQEENLKAKQANVLDPEEKLLESYRRQQETAKTECTQWADQVKSLKINLDKAIGELKAIREKEPDREKKAAYLAVLQDMLPKVASLAEITTKLTESKKKETEISDKVTETKKIIDQMDIHLKEKTRLLDQVKITQSQLVNLERQCEDAGKKYENRRELDKARKLAAKNKQQYELADAKIIQMEKEYTELKKELSQLQELWNSGQAAILAGTLQKGIPCPVCGSTEHSVPAVKIKFLPTEADLKKKRQETEKAEILLNEQRKQAAKLHLSLVQAEGKVEEIERALGTDSNTFPEILEDAFKERKEAYLKAREAVEGLEDLEADINLYHAQRAKNQEIYENLNHQMEMIRSEVIRTKAALDEREKAIPENLRNPEHVQEEIKKIREEINEFDKAITDARNALSEGERNFAAAETALALAEKSLTQAEEKVRWAEESFLRKIKEAGFLEFSHYHKCKRTESEIKMYDKKIQDYKSSVQSALDWLKRAEKAAQGLVEPNLLELTSAFEEAQKLNKEVNREKGQLDITLKNMQQTRDSMDKIESALKTMETRYRTLGRLSDVANGKNSLGMTFQRFVLGALLDDVAISANERLKVMSRGRYLLQRTLDRERTNAAGGLELEVIDNYTGLSRKVVTLSGGESFLASLALALGLAEVVQSYAGGIHLDTIFIDEGFGSLDPDALDYSIRILIDLQKSGRLIGIISHIPELKERIDARLEVKTGERGSTAKFIFS